jgi:hypothetical protein
VSAQCRLRERRLDADKTRAVQIWLFCAARSRWDRIAGLLPGVRRAVREAVEPQMHVRCDLGLDLDGLKQPRIAVTGQSPGLPFQLASAGGRKASPRPSGYGCAVWRDHRVLLRSFTVRPPSWTSKMKCGAGSSWQ